jgi:hypothetical protein
MNRSLMLDGIFLIDLYCCHKRYIFLSQCKISTRSCSDVEVPSISNYLFFHQHYKLSLGCHSVALFVLDIRKVTSVNSIHVK